MTHIVRMERQMLISYKEKLFAVMVVKHYNKHPEGLSLEILKYQHSPKQPDVVGSALRVA